MPESYGISTPTAGGAHRQLIARNTPLATRPIVLTGGVSYLRGAIVYAAAVNGPFVKAGTGALPVTGDVIAIVSESLDLTALPNTLHVGYVGPGEFVRDTVLAASAAMTAPEALGVEEELLHRGINLVKAAYADITDAA